MEIFQTLLCFALSLGVILYYTILYWCLWSPVGLSGLSPWSLGWKQSSQESLDEFVAPWNSQNRVHPELLVAALLPAVPLAPKAFNLSRFKVFSKSSFFWHQNACFSCFFHFKLKDLCNSKLSKLFDYGTIPNHPSPGLWDIRLRLC